MRKLIIPILCLTILLVANAISEEREDPRIVGANAYAKSQKSELLPFTAEEARQALTGMGEIADRIQDYVDAIHPIEHTWTVGNENTTVRLSGEKCAVDFLVEGYPLGMTDGRGLRYPDYSVRSQTPVITRVLWYDETEVAFIPREIAIGDTVNTVLKAFGIQEIDEYGCLYDEKDTEKAETAPGYAVLQKNEDESILITFVCIDEEAEYFMTLSFMDDKLSEASVGRAG